MALKFKNVALLKGLGIHMADVNVGSNTDVPLTNLHPGAPIQVNDTIIDINGEVYTVTAVTDENVHVSDVIQGITLKGPKGDQGTGLLLKGSVATEGDLPADNNKAGDAYLVAGSLHVWDGTQWVDGGSIQGPSGEGFHTITTAVADDAKVAIADIVPNTSVTVGDSLVDANGDVRPIVATDDTNATLGKKTISLKGVAGAKGDPGEAGAQGVAGLSVRVVNAAVDANGTVNVADLKPNTNVAVGDTVIDNEGDVYTITAVDAEAGTATVGDVLANIKGAKGDPGDAGAKGDKGDPGAAGQRGSKATFVEDTSTLTDIQVGDFNINPATGVLSTVVDEA